MGFTELMQDTDRYARISLGDAWICWDETTNDWVVYQRKYGAHKTTEKHVLLENDAVRALILSQENG